MAEISYLYVIGEEGVTDEVKVGRSDAPKRRRQELQTGRGKKLVVHGSWPVPAEDADRLEKACHAALAKVRVKGEVFAISPDLASAFAEHIALHGAVDDFLRLGLAKEMAERRWADLSMRPGASGRWARPQTEAAADAAYEEMKRLDDAFFGMDRARADKIDQTRILLDKLG